MSRLQPVAAALGSDRFTRKRLADGSGVVLDRRRMRVLTLNETGMFLLEEIAAGAGAVERLAERLTEVFDVEPETARRDIEALLVDLEGLLGTGTG